jgi:hypothetical protein
MDIKFVLSNILLFVAADASGSDVLYGSIKLDGAGYAMLDAFAAS